MRIQLPVGEVDLERGTVARAGGEVRLREKERQLLAYLVARPGLTVPRAELYEAIWGYHPATSSRALDSTVRRLRKAVEVDPHDPSCLVSEVGVGYRFCSPAAPAPPRLPKPRDAFVGREAELEALAVKLEGGARLVTVVGFGGTGKTRLVTRFGWTRSQAYPGGVWFCDLSEARSEIGIAEGVARALDVPLGNDPLVQLAHAIAGRGRCLLLLDNTEQVTTAAASVVGRWLDRASEATFVVTSREVLGLPGEEVLALEALPEDEGVALFILRATQAKQDFRADDTGSIAALVRLLDGLPLAIELAAARSRVLSPSMLLARMAERFRLLASTGGRPSRHATLRGTLDWSWELLAPDEQQALAQLAVFEGGFTLEAAEAVLSLDALWPADAVQALVDKSLVRVVGDARFDLLTSVRVYAAEQLDRWSGRIDAEARHGRFFAAFGHQETLEALHHDGGVALRRVLALENANLQAAARRAAQRGEGAVAVATARAAYEVLSLSGPLPEVLGLAETVSQTPNLAPAQRARAAWLLGMALRRLGRGQEALPILEQGLVRAREAGDRRTENEVLGALGNLHAVDGRFEAAHSHLEQALALAREDADPVREGHWLGNLGNLLKQQGRMEEALAHYHQALALAIQVEDRRTEALIRSNLANTFTLEESVEGAIAHLEQALVLLRQLGDRGGESLAVGNLGHIQQRRGQRKEAAENYERALALAAEVGDRSKQALWLGNLGSLLTDEVRLGQALAIARELGDRRFEGIWLGSLGRAQQEHGKLDEARLHLEQALALARELGPRRGEGIWLGALGNLHREQGRRAEARACFASGEAILRSVGDERQLSELLRDRARLDEAEGRHEAARAAREEADALPQGERVPV